MNNHTTDNTVGSILTVLALALNGVDLTLLDAKLLQPLAHIAAFGSGTVAIIVFVLGRIEKQRENKTQPPKQDL